MNDILNEMNMIRVGEIHGPWLLVRSRVGVYIYVTCCCVGSTQFFICLELMFALISSQSRSAYFKL